MTGTGGTAALRRRRVLVASLVAALALTGCAGLPTSGPVTAGNSPADSPSGVTGGSYIADAPEPGATPGEIVDGFLQASIEPAQNWATAREYLDGDLVSTWNPSASTLIDLTDRRDTTHATVDGATATLAADVTAEATVDEDGRYQVAGGGSTSLAFELAQNADGEWRIVSAPDGIVLDRLFFAELYTAYDLYYFDATWSHLVPDRRWFLNRQNANAATRIVQELVDGSPSEWLASGVETAFGSDLELSRGTVSIDSDRVAHIAVTGAAGADDETISRMTAQLEQSLSAVTVRSVSLTVDGQESDVEAAPVGSTKIDPRPLVLREDGFGYLSGGDLSAVDGLSDVLLGFPEDHAISSITLSPDQETAAVGLDDGEAMRVTSEGPDEIDTGGPVIDPAMDRFGRIWTVRADEPQSLTAWDADLVSTASLAGGWSDLASVSAIDVSRDGSRIAAIVSSGDEEWVIVSAVERELDGTPVAVGTPMRVVQLRLAGVGLAWLDDGTIGIAAGGTDNAIMIQQPIGGPGTDTSAASPLDVVAIGAGNQDSAVRLLTGGGELQVRRGSGWTTSASDVKVLATQLGLPG
ncbi:LpqB family beta-propeller domain-containing protein [Microbacterium betulae]|uniref:LpqB family beta-propeller domain-containing protein n=1 Tax=Microbacterium betulae TaxID=2981139 RepID=A0AA97FJM5_9MICO|nr:GerMN domain-containing protein [Microbacterium sp. AB]WOF24206.1 LpqB family beta-propeller domain-containing protein [Microbacterium sp. AB]